MRGPYFLLVVSLSVGRSRVVKDFLNNPAASKSVECQLDIELVSFDNGFVLARCDIRAAIRSNKGVRSWKILQGLDPVGRNRRVENSHLRPVSENGDP